MKGSTNCRKCIALKKIQIRGYKHVTNVLMNWAYFCIITFSYPNVIHIVISLVCGTITAKRQLHPVSQTASRWPNAGCRWWSKHHINMGLGFGESLILYGTWLFQSHHKKFYAQSADLYRFCSTYWLPWQQVKRYSNIYRRVKQDRMPRFRHLSNVARRWKCRDVLMNIHKCADILCPLPCSRRRASKPSWRRVLQRVMLWPSARTRRCASAAAVTETSPCGIFIIRPLSGSYLILFRIFTHVRKIIIRTNIIVGCVNYSYAGLTWKVFWPWPTIRLINSVG